MRAGLAGQVLGADIAGLLVAVADGAVRLSGLTDMAGSAVDATALGALVGRILPQVPGADVLAVGKAEPAWEAALLGAMPAIPPYPMDHGPR